MSVVGSSRRKVVDVHAHTFPQKVFDRVWNYFDEHHWPIYYRTGEAERAAVLEENTVAYTTLCYAHRAGMAPWLNDYALDYAREHPRAIPTGTLYPEDDDLLAYVEQGIARGFKGFKIHLEVQKFDPAHPRLERAYAMMTEAGCVLTLHTAGMPLAGEWTGAEHFKRFLRMAPRLTTVIAHAGAADFADYWALAGEHPLYFDTAMVGVDYDGFGPIDETMRQTVLAHPDRFVFGSDFPSIPYPWSHQLDVVGSWGLESTALDRVLYENAAELYRLG